MNAAEIEKRFALINDINKFAQKEALTRIMDIANNADLGREESLTVVMKTSQDMLVGSLLMAVETGLSPKAVRAVLKNMTDHIEKHLSKHDKQKAH